LWASALQSQAAATAFAISAPLLAIGQIYNSGSDLVLLARPEEL
jgi:hypothetical protein